MKKVILFSVLSFVIGIALAASILVNPFGWKWAYDLHHAVLSWAETSPGETPSSAEGQLWTCGMHPQVVRDEPGTCPICGMDLTPVVEAAEEQLWTCGMHPEVIREEPGSCPICGMDLTPVKQSSSGKVPEKERKILYYRAPMDPTYTSDKPGKSPMGMDLVPVYADEAEEKGSTVRIDPAFVQTIGVETSVVRRTDIPFRVRAVGNVTFNDEQQYLVTTKYEGWVEKVFVNYVGESVRKGQRLFEIYSPQLVTTQKEYLNALDYVNRIGNSDYENVKKRAEALLNASRQRLAYWDITSEQLDQLETTRTPQRTMTVFAPASGVVVEKMSQSLEGMFVKPGMNLYRIVDLSTVWVEAEVFESQLPLLRIGQAALVEFPYQPGKSYRGRIRFIYPYFDARTRTLKVSIALPNPGFELRQDMYADVTFDVPSARNVIVVPEEAVIFSGERNLVVTRVGEGEFQVKEVTLGLNGEGLYEIRGGLEEGETVVVSSQFLIDSESRLKEAIQKIVSASQQSETSQVHQH